MYLMMARVFDELGYRRYSGQLANGIAAVSAAVPAAADVGLQVLKDGGNAFDAAVAAALVETVWLPMKCGLAGDVVALLQRAGGPVEALLAIRRGPLALHQGGPLQGTGGRRVGEEDVGTCMFRLVA